MDTISLQQREWVYAGQPAMYDIAPCSCGNNKIQWSEFVDRLWCEKCQKDFTPEHWGVFDGPITMEVSKLLGICFDRVNIKTGEIVPFESENWEKTRP